MNKKLITGGLIIAGVLLLAVGIATGGVSDVLNKAIRICYECIGIGGRLEKEGLCKSSRPYCTIVILPGLQPARFIRATLRVPVFRDLTATHVRVLWVHARSEACSRALCRLSTGFLTTCSE